MEPAPRTVIATHLNYRSRAEQRGRIPTVPSYFQKPVSSISGDGDAIGKPEGTELLLIEGEVALIIGTRAENVSPEQGVDHIGWICAANDVGLFDMRWNDRGSNLMTKGQRGFTPLGNRVPADQVDIGDLTLVTRVNGQEVQRDHTSNLIFDFGYVIADLSRFLTLEPGDVILTGTPAGACPVEPGDLIEVDIEGVSRVANTVEKTPSLPAFGAQPKVTAASRSAALGVGAPRPVVLSEAAKQAFRSVATATITVQLRRRGIRNSVIAGLKPTRPGHRLLGYAFTLRYVPLREDVRDADTAPLNAQKQAIETIGSEEVLVIDARREPGAGTIGDILAARALHRGATGIVTDGGLRDSGAVAALDIPTYYQAEHAATLGLIHYPLESNVPIACGGSLVIPGDVIVGDDDGVVVVPAAMAEEVAHDCVAQEERESWALARVQAGDSVRGVYPITAERESEFQEWRTSTDRS